MQICVFSKFKEEFLSHSKNKRFEDLKEKGIANGTWIC